MRNVVKVLFLSAVVVALTGCGINGKWTMQSVTPEAAKAHCPIQAICLMDDLTYQSCEQAAGKCKVVKGTYKFDQSAKALTFKTEDGKEYKYTAELAACGGQLKVSGGEKGKEWTAVMKRGECSKECCKGDAKACNPKGCDPKTCQGPCGEKKADAKADAKKAEAKPEAKKAEAKPEAKKAEAKPEAKKAEAKKTEPKPEATKVEPAKTDTTKKAEPAKADK